MPTRPQAWIALGLDLVDRQIVLLSAGLTEEAAKTRGYPRAGENICYKDCFDVLSQNAGPRMIRWLNERGIPRDEAVEMVRGVGGFLVDILNETESEITSH